MKLWIMSDLHQEQGETHWQSNTPEHDAVVLAGDIHVTPEESISYAERMFDKPVIYVAGNHEFHNTNIDDEIAKGRERSRLSSRVRYLENDEAIVGGVHFIGATLWTDFLLFGEKAKDLCCDDADLGMPDFSLIRESSAEDHKRPRLFTARRAISRHNASLASINQALARFPEMPKVVVTHHAPHPMSVHPKFKDDWISAAFISDLSTLITEHRPQLWIHGHVHRRFDYLVGSTRIVCNCKGYGTEDDAFDPGFVVEVGDET
jgi:Icc-related predicted phosphoesterase